MEGDDFIIHGLNDPDTESWLRPLIRDVLRVIEEKEHLPNLVFVLPYPSCSAMKIYVSPITANRDTGLIDFWIIGLAEDLLRRSNSETTYVVAHEIAHAVLDHTGHYANPDDWKDIEIEADKKVIEWGFGKELEETPSNYIYGTGLRPSV